MLNSYWGKYSQQGNKCQVKAISFPARLHILLNNNIQEIQIVCVMNNEMIELVYRHVIDEDPVQVNINIFVACFTTW